MNARHVVLRAVGASLLCLAPCFASLAADADDIAEMKRAIEALREENRALTRRIQALEAEKSKHEQALQPGTSPTEEQVQPPPTAAERKEQERLEQRVEELEKAKTAQEDAVRSIIRESFAKAGSKINEAVTFSGALEVATGRARDFSGKSQSTIQLTTVDLEFDIQVNEWSSGFLAVAYDSGTNVIFPTTTGFQTSVDRINLDRAFVTIGDPQRFPPFAKLGRMVLPFGISTGSPWADVLSTENPLTVEVFETKKTAIGFGVGFPTPSLKPTTPPVLAPPVRPLVITPLVSSISRELGWDPPPTRPKPPALTILTPAPPLFNAGVYFYSGDPATTPSSTSRPGKHVNATGGFHIKGDCGRPYEELRPSSLCPRSLAIDLSYNTSVYDSLFLDQEYAAFLSQIGLVPGGSASLKSSLGPVLLVAEWNGALERARFLDDLGRRVNIRPSAWQVSLGYQFDWNPWVEAIGEQGTYVSVGYSQSTDLAGVTQLIDGQPTRVGFVPRRRLILTAGEWVLDGLRLAVEYSYNWDYAKSAGGTGNAAYGLFATLLYVW